ncbi:1-deoxy-D-xylulose-5-phosphate synthase [Clostridia bacterium]|nr:1-deoxy-D-xylulose-5-phosphate synthase [Clostridia bacterium]
MLENVNSVSDLKKLTIKELPVLAGEIRDFLITSISETGGHLASNLGVVELTIALHYCFDSPVDKIVWDVGHQSYVHKILTGRRDKFDTLRKYKGLSGFPKTSESPHDIVDTGHSSTSISAALGLATARDLSGEKHSVLAVIGDGSMTGGLAFEGINHAGRLDTNLIVILNDNQMSISENVGALSKHLNRLRTAPSYSVAKENVHRFLKRLPIFGEALGEMTLRTKDAIKYLLIPNTMFDEYGFNYIGPFDGHNLPQLIDVLKRVKKMKGPILLHVYTKKGKGYPLAERSPENYHGIEPYDIESGRPIKVKVWNTYSDVFGKTLLQMARDNDKIVAITAAMPSGVGLTPFAAEFPSRVFDVGIAEGHAVTFAAGLARAGYVPVFAVYSTFLQRGYDQILHDIALPKLHAVFAVDRAGIVGGDGETHQGLYDVSFLCGIPNMTVLAPKNKNELIDMMKFAADFDAPIAIRYPKGAVSSVYKEVRTPIVFGKSETLEQGRDILIIFAGDMGETAAYVYEQLSRGGYEPTLVNARFMKPIDTDLVDALADYKYVFVLESVVETGGLANSILFQANKRNTLNKEVVFMAFNFPDTFVAQGGRPEILREYGLDEKAILGKILKAVGDEK